jgi:hypothetical protein
MDRRLFGVEEVRWDGGGTEPAGEYRTLCNSEALPLESTYSVEYISD